MELKAFKQTTKKLQRHVNENDSRAEGPQEGKYELKIDEERVLGVEFCEERKHPGLSD